MSSPWEWLFVRPHAKNVHPQNCQSNLPNHRQAQQFASQPADLAGLNRMLGHHQEALSLLLSGTERVTHPDLRDFISNLLRDRRQEIEQLRRLGATSAGPASQEKSDVNGPGEVFDVLFVEALIKHETAGVDLAKNLEATTSSPKVKSFAKGVENMARSELTQLYKWREQWQQPGHRD